VSKVPCDVKKVEVSKGRPSNSITQSSSCTRSSYKWNPCPVPSSLVFLMVHCGLIRISFLSLGVHNHPGQLPSPSQVASISRRLFDLPVNPRCHPPPKKYILGGTGRVLIQLLDVHPFPKISNAHEDVQLPVSKTDGMRDVAA